MMLLHDAIHSGKPESGPLANAFGGEKWLKDALHRLRVHARAGIADLQAYELSHTGLRTTLQICGVNVATECADDEFATFGHGIARVHRQVHQHLFQHSCVRHHGWKFCRRANIKTDIFPQHRTQQSGHVVDDLVHVHRFGLRNLLAAERKQLTRQTRGTL